MNIKENASNRGTTTVKWIGSREPNLLLPQLEHKNVYFYKKCIIGTLLLAVGDYVLVSNADAAEPDTIDGCDIAKILYLYESFEMFEKDPYRAIVQWYSRPARIPHKEFDNDIGIDFDHDIVEEHRPYDSDICLEAVFRKCKVINGCPGDRAVELLRLAESKSRSLPMFVCRFKFVKVKRSYRLIPLQYSNEHELYSKENTPRKVQRFPLVEEKQQPVTEPVEFIDMSKFAADKVSPIKIVGGRSVVRLSFKKNSESTVRRGSCVSPPSSQHSSSKNRSSRVAAARRNLNLSLENEPKTTADSDCMNYSIIKESAGDKQSSTPMKIKLRRSSSRLLSEDINPLVTEVDVEKPTLRAVKKPSTTNNADIYQTPSKKRRDSCAVMVATATARRKSILKSASKPVVYGTPKRSIQLCDIVEKRIFKEGDIISTPKGRVHTEMTTNNVDPDYSPTPKRISTNNRRNSTKSQASSPGVKVRTPRTPTQKIKMIRSGELNPTMEKRRSSGAVGRKSELQLARESLHVSVVPASLPCRSTEFNNIYSFLEGKIQDQCGGCMYVSGVPGTGKTATVTAVVRALKLQAGEGKLPGFDFIGINGMQLTEPRQAYVQIYKELTGRTVSWEHAYSLLEKRFTTPAPRRVTTVLVVDELDILCNRRQDVVYNLIDWPTKSAARLVVVTIANTMDLPERLLISKITSRLGLTRLIFHPYTHKQLQEIVTARLNGSGAFKSDAVQLVARKVAAVSGDARRALDICRRATEIAETADEASVSRELSRCVGMLHVQRALTEMISSAKVQAIKKCSRLEQIFLQAAVAEVTRTGVEETSFMGVFSQFETIAAFMGVAIPPPGCALRICCKLGAERLIICEHSCNDVFQKILLNVSMDDVHYALKIDNNK